MMHMSKLLFSLLLLLFSLTSTVQGKVRDYTMYELIELSDVTFTGIVTSVSETSATVTVDTCLYGDLKSTSVDVTPITVKHCKGKRVSFKKGDRFLIFGNKTKEKGVTISAYGRGKYILDTQNTETEIEAFQKLVTLSQHSEEQRLRSMLDNLKQANKRLRSEADRYIIRNKNKAELYQKCKSVFVTMLQEDETSVPLSVVVGMENIKAEEAIPRLIALTKNDYYAIYASKALRNYDTEESVKALIALTNHKDSNFRFRASQDLSNSNRPEVREVFQQLLNDDNQNVVNQAKRYLQK